MPRTASALCFAMLLALPAAKAARPDREDPGGRGDGSDVRSPAALADLLEDYAGALASDPAVADDPRWAERADDLAMQRGALASGLYWHTDLNEAKAAAAASDRPVYADLFLTPFADPWMGMLEEGSYSGLLRGGVVDP